MANLPLWKCHSSKGVGLPIGKAVASQAASKTGFRSDSACNNQQSCAGAHA